MPHEWRKRAARQVAQMPPEVKEVRELMLQDFWTFLKIINPNYVYGDVHKRVAQWFQKYNLYGIQEAETDKKLLLLPRAHLKSHLLANKAAWLVTRHPEITSIYLSSTTSLAEKQLSYIKDILDSKTYRMYFPEYIHPEVGKRKKWNSEEIVIDHPMRGEDITRDSTIKIAGLTTTTTGFHCDVLFIDDVVEPGNAYTEGGRDMVTSRTSQFESVRNPTGYTIGAGTRYHGRDQYGIWMEETYDLYDQDEETGDWYVKGKKNSWEVFEEVVETDGNFIWPATVRPDGKQFGFNHQILAKTYAGYHDKAQFWAQYYNNPNQGNKTRISRDKFQYWTARNLKRNDGQWEMFGRRLNIFVAIDFAYSMGKRADSSAIAVIGMDYLRNIYILDLIEFKTDNMGEYIKEVRDSHIKWGFTKVRAETTAAQQIIVNTMKDKLREEGLSLSIEEYKPSRHEGTKYERMAATLEPLYEEMKIWHPEGGLTLVLEDQLLQERPANDDLKDAVTNAINIAKPPSQPRGSRDEDYVNKISKYSHRRFGGISYGR